ncbi:molybdotransferase-like divisome protein Glp [Aeromicrobium sp.]|uniref:molybdotransferase-like divisome protein Glp n=1 Tax=Aeromicrobium sp. TaxID=1871063 RepID=UPI003D6B64A4
MSSETPDSGPDQSMLPLGPDETEEPTPEASTEAAPAPDDPAREAHSSAAPAAPEPPPPGPRVRARPASISDDMITVEDHLERILRGVGPLEAYDQPIVESLGLPLHENFVAPIDLPRFANSGMDGYAVRAEDVKEATLETPVTLPVVGEILAGSARPFAISAGTAVKIMTGAPIPRGADSVVPFERTDGGNARVSIQESPAVGAHVRTQGSDVQAGDLVLPAGTVLGAREIGLLAALGAPRAKARPRPRVVIISTGSELREPGTHLDYDSINDSNSYMLASAVREAGAIAYRVGAVDDNPRSFRKMLSDQLVRADLVVTSGGVSMGEKDVVKETLSALGTVSFDKVAMQPGKPQGFGRVFDEQKPIITVPGNPVSAYVSFEVFVLPAIRRLMGRTPYRRPMVHAVLASDLQSRTGLRQYVRGVFEVTHRGAKVTPIQGHGSHLMGSLAKANALIVVGEDETALNLGDTVRTLVLDRPF